MIAGRSGRSQTAGFREVEHTADWELEVWAADLTELLEIAARGMYHLSGASIDSTEAITRDISLEADDRESLLVGFLNQLVYLAETDHLAFNDYTIKIDGLHLTALLSGGRIGEIAKVIKAITFHNIAVQETQDGLRVRIVFDV